MASRNGRRSVLRMRTVAGQVFLLQVAIVVLLVATCIVALVLQSHADSEGEAVSRSLAVAETFAHSPGMDEALRSADPSAILQPTAEAVRRDADVDFLVVVAPDGTRYTHPVPGLIGKTFTGNIQPVLRGETLSRKFNSGIGPLVAVAVPIRDDSGTVIGVVSAGVTVDRVSGAANDQFPLIFGTAGGILLLTTAGAALVSKRLRRQTHGLGPEEMTRMYEHHDAVLHSVREGVLIVGGDGRLLLANDEARRLLNLPVTVEGRQVTELGLGQETTELLASGRVASDEIHRVSDRLLAVNQRPTDRDGGPPGSVATFRDTTDLQALSGRADVAQGRLQLLYEAGAEIGTKLDVVRTCEELVEFAIERFADYATVDLAETVLRGEEPTSTGAGSDMRRIASGGPGHGTAHFPLDSVMRYLPTTRLGAGLGKGEAVLEPVLNTFNGWEQQSPERARALVEAGFHSMIAVPLRARGPSSAWRSSSDRNGRRPMTRRTAPSPRSWSPEPR